MEVTTYLNIFASPLTDTHFNFISKTDWHQKEKILTKQSWCGLFIFLWDR